MALNFPQLTATLSERYGVWSVFTPRPLVCHNVAIDSVPALMLEASFEVSFDRQALDKRRVTGILRVPVDSNVKQFDMLRFRERDLSVIHVGLGMLHEGYRYFELTAAG